MRVPSEMHRLVYVILLFKSAPVLYHREYNCVDAEPFSDRNKRGHLAKIFPLHNHAQKNLQSALPFTDGREKLQVLHKEREISTHAGNRVCLLSSSVHADA